MTKRYSPVAPANARKHPPRSGAPNAPPCFVLTRVVATRQVVTGVSEGASAYGIRMGMTLAQARALYAGVANVDHRPTEDVRGLEALARWMQRFSPVVMPVIDYPDERGEEETRLIGEAEDDAGAASADSFPRDYGIYLDVTGCERVFNGLDNLLSQLLEGLTRFGVRARVGVAGHMAGAWALTFGEPNRGTGNLPVNSFIRFDGPQAGRPCHEQDARRALPVEALRLPERVVGTLRHLGLVRVGQVLDLPRGTLASRFGGVLVRRVNQLLGVEREVMTPLPCARPIEAAEEFDGPVPSTEALLVAFERMLPGLIEELARRGMGARRIDLQLVRAYAPTILKTIHLARPTRNGRTILNLFRCVIETLEGSGFREEEDVETARTRTPNPEP